MKSSLSIAIFAAGLLTACGSQPSMPEAARATPGAAPDRAVSPGEQLETLVEAYFEESLQLNPILATFIGDHRYDDQLPNYFGPDYRAKVRALDERCLSELVSIDPATLSAEDRITYEIFKRERTLAIEAERFPSYMLPINQAGSFITLMPALGSGTNAQPFETAVDYENWLKRLEDYGAILDQAIVNMREGVLVGVVQPRPVMEKVLVQLDDLIVANPKDSLFYAPLRSMPDSISADEKARLAADYSRVIEMEVTPAHQRLRDYIRDEYMPHTRDSVAWTALPDGKAWYDFTIREHTTTDLTAEQIHEIGLAEVARILGEMDGVRQQVGFSGDLNGFFEFLKNDPRFYFTQSADLIAGYQDIKRRIDARLPSLFSVFPKADYEIREVEAFRAQSAAGASYQPPSADGSRPGIFYVNTYNLKAQPRFGMETLSLHEASPGHHFQIAIQQELEDLPRFRRFGGDYTAFVEGWALYAEYLGKELGLFTDPYQYFGRLNDEQLRAMRLVVDTGLHAKGWSREKAIRYMIDNSTLAESDVVSEVERYIAWPGQALGYKIGDLKIQQLRHEAEKALGPRFDLRDFHREVLCDGAVPLDVLEAKIRRWVAARR
jgi:uncharacterized protein (DUF885 family)